MAIVSGRLARFVGGHGRPVLAGGELFFHPSYRANLIGSWLPALDGVRAKLRTGALVADIGCGRGAATLLMATAYPASTVVGTDSHAASIAVARKRAAGKGLADRVWFEVASAQTFTGGPYDLVTTFDTLHDMGDPVAVARHVRERLAGDGTWMIVEPLIGPTADDLERVVGAAGFGAFRPVAQTPFNIVYEVRR
jgi:2-polyprenyl-3-methyl-5-hydroxy-6-metoxy-1,4-benzoquinol methylase